MDAVIACPKCRRMLRRPAASAGLPYRCPACEATFECWSRAETAPAGFTATPGHRPKSSAPPQATSTDDLSKNSTTPFNFWYGDRSVLSQGLSWILLALLLDLVVFGLDLALFGCGVTNKYAYQFYSPRFDSLYQQWGWTVILLRVLILLVIGVLLLIALAFCLRYSTRKTTDAIYSVSCLSMVFYLPRLAGVLFRDPSSVPINFWKEWPIWADLYFRWPMECILIVFLYWVGRHLEHEPTRARLRLSVAFLILESLFLVMPLAEWLSWVRDWIDPFSRQLYPGTTACTLLLIARLAVAVQLLRALNAARTALAEAGPHATPEDA